MQVQSKAFSACDEFIKAMTDLTLKINRGSEQVEYKAMKDGEQFIPEPGMEIEVHLDNQKLGPPHEGETPEQKMMHHMLTSRVTLNF